ncbi:putative GTP-binding protein EngB [Smittium culicis]|uniref:Putative GTP-binding protein EngB n=1 Tax=Smittium culicis TaxID=133412 RepID=A0A1R1YSH3_9FUNG|nr:putative GTP-binding protein EngB [Smittium culicis]
MYSMTHIPPFKFFAGATNKESFPPETVPEIAFIGRSNVGKSTLLNCLGNTGVARVSDRPGATQQINFYNSGSDFVLVDMPGYGFAYASDKKIDTWTKLIEEYIKTRKTLKRLMV